METRKKKYFENLDALRFLTFLVIFFRHTFFTNNPQIAQSDIFHWFQNLFYFAALVGLDFFSVLSSFLITWLILSEYKTTHDFNLKNFYMRRILRLWPLYFLIIFLGYFFIPFIASSNNQPVSELPPIGWFIFFGLNYYMGYINENFLFSLALLWFISVEEQFYIIWGIALKYFLKFFNIICLSFILISLTAKYFFSNENFPSFYDTLNYLPNFALGAFLAQSCFEQNGLYIILKKISRKGWVLVYVVFLLVIIFNKNIFSNMHLNIFKHVILSALFCIILFGQTFGKNTLFKAGKYRWVNYLGRLNFGLYCWHGIVIIGIKKLSAFIHYQESYVDVLVIFPMLILLLTIAISILSYEIFETKFLKLKDYFSASI